MDEPLSNLDAKLRVSMRAALNQLHERLGTTTVYVTHDQVEAMTLGDRVCVLRDGRLQQVDTPQALFESPVNLFVAGFIGSPAMNFVIADLVRDDGPAATFAGFRLPVPARCSPASRGLTSTSAARSSWASARRTSRTARSPTRPGRGSGHRRGHRRPGHRDPRDLHHRRAAGRARRDRQRRRRHDEEDEAVAALAGGKSLWTARVSSRSAVRPGQPLELAVDTTRLHFFDPASGESIGHPLSAGAAAGRSPRADPFSRSGPRRTGSSVL